MANILLPILAGQMPQGFCFTNWQNLLNTISNAQNAVLPGGMFYNYGDMKPVPEYEAYPWLRTIDMRWYQYDGDWITPVNYDASERRLYVGTLAALNTYDGGDTGTASDRSGPMWEEDTDFKDRLAMGVGTTLANPGDTGGEAEHTLTEAEGGVGTHTHAFGLSNPASDDAYFSRPGTSTVQGYTGYYITGSGPNIVAGQTTADLFTLPSGSDGKGAAAPTPFPLIPPVVGVYFVKWTGRTYRKV